MVAPAPSRRRLVRGAAMLCATLFALAGLTCGGLWLRLQAGPIDAPFLAARIETGLEKALGRGLDVDMGPVRLVAGEHGPKVTLERLRLRDAEGATVLSAPSAEATLDLWSALKGGSPVRMLELVGVELRVEARADGSLSLALGADETRGITFGGPAHTPGAEAGAPPPPLAEAATAAAVTLIETAAGEDGPLGALKSVSLQRGRLVVVGPGGRIVTSYDDFAFAFQRWRSKSEARLDLSARRPAGLVTAALEARLVDGRRALDVEVKDLTADEISMFAGFGDAPVDVDLSFSAKASVAFGARGQVEAASGSFKTGAGYVKLDDADHEPFLINRIAGGFRWDPAQRAVIVESTRLEAGDTNLSLEGAAARLDPSGASWGFELSSTGNRIGAEVKSDGPMALGDLSVKGRYAVATGVLTLDSFKVANREATMSGSGEIVGGAGGPAVRLALDAQRMKARDVMRFWPSVAAPEARAWLLKAFKGGALEKGALRLDLDREAILSPKGTPIPDGALALDFEFADGALDYLEGAPPLEGVVGKGRVTGRTAFIEAAKAHVVLSGGRKLAVSDARFEILDFAPTPIAARLVARVQGGFDATVEYLARPAFKAFVALPAMAQNAKGQVDARLTLDLELGRGAGEPRARVEAQAQNVVLEQFLGSEKLEGGSFAILAEGQALSVKGAGRLFGAQAQVETRGGDKPEALVSLTLDDAARQRRGMAIPGLSGPVSVRIVAGLPENAKSAPRRAQVELDFMRAAFDGLFGVVSKPAGRPGKASFALTEQEGGLALDNLAFEAGPASARGSASLGADGALRSLKLASVKFSPGDDLRLEAQRGAEGMKVVARGQSLDARPFLKLAGGSGAGAGGGGGSAGDVDLDLKSTLLTGYNRQALANADLRLVKRGGKLRQLALTGKFGRDPLSLSLGRDGDTVLVETEDAGSTLAFLDVYKRMEAGGLSAVAKIGDNRLDVAFTIRKFLLRDEPAMRRLVTESAAARGDAGAVSAKVDVQSVPFNRLYARIVRTADRISIQDGALSGPTLGLTMEGTVETRNERLALTGAFVPAYAINNFFARLPLFGPILGGGKEEGLFAVNYRLGGTMAQPDVQVNPLSAIAPGFLRKIFSFESNPRAEGIGGAGRWPAPGAQAGGGASEPVR
jgi:hypothetical protein